MKKILIPIDGSEYSKLAVSKGRDLAKAFKSDVVLLNVIQIEYPIITAGHGGQSPEFLHHLYEDARKNSTAYLDDAKRMFDGMDNKVEAITMEGDAANAIVEYADKGDVDLVVMGSHGLGAILDRLLTGSVTTKVLHHIHKPVLVVK